MQESGPPFNPQAFLEGMLRRGATFHCFENPSVAKGLDSGTELELPAAELRLNSLPVDKIHRLPAPIELCGYRAELVGQSLGNVYLIFPNRCATEIAKFIGLADDEGGDVPRPGGLSSTLDVYVENEDGSFQPLKEEGDIESLAAAGRVYDNMYYRCDEYPDQGLVRVRILIAHESSRFPRFTLLGHIYTSYWDDESIEKFQELAQERQQQREQEEEIDELGAVAVNFVDGSPSFTSLDFLERRRQQFITEQYFISLKKHFGESEEFWSKDSPEADSPAQAKSLATASIAGDSYMLLSLNYTAGASIEPLRDNLENIVSAHERYAEFKKTYEQDENEPPLYFAEIDEYQRCLQLIGLCYLLHRRDLLPRIAAMQDPNYYGHDVVYEELLAYELTERYDTDQMFHKKCYEPLLAAMYEDTDEESIEDIKKYCKNWFPSLKKAPWHNSHLRMSETDGDYFGYWAFEAGAVMYLLELDDSTIDHMVYPRDLVAWARANEHLSVEAQTKLRCEANEPCPKTGYWLTPAKLGSRRHFNQGEIMPDFPGSTYGITIWMWGQNQD